jgi:hypothetical protein
LCVFVGLSRGLMAEKRAKNLKASQKMTVR